MNRSSFLKLIILQVAAMKAGNALTKLHDELTVQDMVMPALFVGHGSPMNGIENNEFSTAWERMGVAIPKPAAILVVSAHWLTRGTQITAMEKPRTIHDFGGFPRELFEVQYPAGGSPRMASKVREMLQGTNAGLDHEWGLDHGAWTILRRMYPAADIPVMQLSIDYYQPAEYHYNIGKQLAGLRKKGVLVLSSGNMIHNLGLIDFANIDKPDYGYDWAREMHLLLKEKIIAGDHRSLIDYEKLNKSVKLAIPTPDHYYPLLYTLGMQQKNEEPVFFNDKLFAGSLNMTSVIISC
ncbi:MAG: 4,5-DOPA dioxygenase extradiol [Ignavibacteriales bacterium]|nr:4,5-DOPA dioxygenase extradiol [Ignavibacteriales bacterium]